MISGKLKKTSERADLSDIENDIGKWFGHPTKAVVNHWIKKGPKDLQNCDAKLIAHKSLQHKCKNKCREQTLRMFERHIQSGETVNSSWMCFTLVKVAFTATSANLRQPRDFRLHEANFLTETMKPSDVSILVLILKQVSTTRWSCRADASKALERSYSCDENKNDQNGFLRICCKGHDLYN